MRAGDSWNRNGLVHARPHALSMEGLTSDRRRETRTGQIEHLHLSCSSIRRGSACSEVSDAAAVQAGTLPKSTSVVCDQSMTLGLARRFSFSACKSAR